MKLTSLFVSFFVVALASPVFADTIAVSNASFETTNSLDRSCGLGCTFNIGPIPDWTLTGAGGSFQPSSAMFSSLPDGSIVAYSNGGTISQTLSTSLIANTTYTLSVDVGRRFDANLTNYTIALFAGGTLLDSLTLSNGLIPVGTFADESFSYTSGSTPISGNLMIALSTAGPQQMDYDNVRLTGAAVRRTLS